MNLNKFRRTGEEWDALMAKLAEEERAKASESPTCLLCLVGQRKSLEMIWCDKCTTQVCIGHANSITLKDWEVTSYSMLCPKCRCVKTIGITISC